MKSKQARVAEIDKELQAIETQYPDFDTCPQEEKDRHMRLTTLKFQIVPEQLFGGLLRRAS